MKYLILFLMCSNVLANASTSLIVDKKNGSISVIDAGKPSIVKPALLGKVHSNRLDMNNYNRPGRSNNITPAGHFTIKKMFSWRLNEPMLVFIQGKASVASIHPLWMGNPDQKRVQRLESATPDDNYITGGCINVEPKFFYDVLNNLPDGTSLEILPE